MEITFSNSFLNFKEGKYIVRDGKAKIIGQKKLIDLQHIFENKIHDTKKIAYDVYVENFEKNTKENGKLQFGLSILYPGKVNNEYFKTSGHFHEKRGYSEYYFCISGEGLLILMNEKGNFKIEKICSGSVHYIPGDTAHRLVNISDDRKLKVAACWNADAGHDYSNIGQLNDLTIIFENGDVVAFNKKTKEKSVIK